VWIIARHEVIDRDTVSVVLLHVFSAEIPIGVPDGYKDIKKCRTKINSKPAKGVGSVMELREQFLAMKKWLWAKNEGKVLGRPTDAPSGNSSHRARFCSVV
jgi:hypothetical protein